MRYLIVAVDLLLLGFLQMPVSAQRGATNGEWRHYGGDLGNTKYAALDQITADNFNRLAIAWSWTTADEHLTRSSDHGSWRGPAGAVLDALREEEPDRWETRPRISGLNATPLMVNGVLYISTALSQAAAIDAVTGKTLWVYDPRSYESGTPGIPPWRHRGVAFWSDEDQSRVLWATSDYHLIAVDAKTGEPDRQFGTDGRVDLMVGLPRATRGDRDAQNLVPVYSQSPPIIVRDTVIVGSSINDYTITKEMPPGWVRAYDVRTGEHKWDFHTVPQQGDEYGADTWLDESWRYSGNTNVWSMMSADEELGYVYLPIGTPTGDYYGGHRLGDNLFAESLVCIDVETGERVWHFQMVHHGVWDYDNPAAPILLDITVDGRPVEAVAQVTKQGFVYTFDRITGEPVWPIEEQPVSTTTDLEGEVLSPTQPFPTKPAPFEYQGAIEDDLIDFTPELRQLALRAVDGFRLGPLYTPQSLAGTIQRPSVAGAATWTGAAADPETGWLYVPSSNGHSVIRYRQARPGEPATFTYVQAHGAEAAPGPQMPQGLPLWKPPYSRMTAIDMNAGEHRWMTPLGNGDRFRTHPRLRDLDLPPLGGDGRGRPLATKTLLVTALAAGGTDGGPRLAAYDKTTGREVGSVDLPAGAIGVPMTFMVEGKQYLAVTIGGAPARLVALTLP